MTRQITATLSGYDSPGHRFNWVLEIAYDTTPLRIWNGNGTITIAGLDGEFLPSHGIGEMPEAQFGFDANEIALGLHLAIADPTIIAIIQNGGHGRVAVRVWGLYSDGDENYYSAPHDDNSPAFRVFQGALDFVSYQFDAESTPRTLKIAVPVEHRFYSDNGVRHRGAQFTQYTQSRIDADDTSWRFLPFLQRQTVLGRWGPAPAVPKVKSGFFSQILSIALVVGITLISGGTAAAAAFTGFTAFVQQRLARSAAKRAAREYGRLDQRIEIVSNDPIPVRRFVFGNALVGGDQLFLGVVDDVHLQQTVMIADHSIEEMQSFWVGIGAYTIGDNFRLTVEENLPANETDYADLIRASARIDGVSRLEIPVQTYKTEYKLRERRTGPEQIVSFVRYEVTVPDIFGFEVSEWNPARDTATGTTIVFIEMEFDTEMNTGTHRRVPWQNIRFLVRGYNKVYDPRDKSFGYSDNAALIAGAFMNLIGGFPYIWADGTVETAALTDEGSAAQTGGISAEDLIIAANICEENGWTVAGGIDYDDDFAQVKGALETSMMGSIFFDGWNYIIRAAHASEIKGTINDETPLGNISGTFHRRLEDLFNSVTGKIRNDPLNARYEEANYPVFEDPEALALDITPRQMTLDLPYTNSTLSALQLSSIALARNRAGMELDINWPGRGSLAYRPGDRLMVNLTMPVAIENTVFIIAEISRDYQRNTHRLTLMEDPDSLYEYSEEVIEGLMALVADPVPPDTGFGPTVLPNPTGVRVYTSYETSGYVAPDGTVSFEVLLEVNNIAPDYIIEVQKLHLDSWVSVAVGYSEITNDGFGTVSVGPLKSDTVVSLRVRYRHVIGLVSEWIHASPYTVPRDDGPPPSPAILEISNTNGETVSISISGVDVPDMSHFEVRFTRANLYNSPANIETESQWRAAELLSISSVPPVAQNTIWTGVFYLYRTGTYRIFARAVDRSGNYSAVERAPSDTTDFIYRSATRTLAIHGHLEDWDGVHFGNGFIVGRNNLVFPITQVSGQELDTVSDFPDAIERWNNERGWFITPSSQIRGGFYSITFPEIDLGENFDAVYSIDAELLYPPDRTVNKDKILEYWLRQYHNGGWGNFTQIEQRWVICASRVQLRIRLRHHPLRTPPQSFGLRTVKQNLNLNIAETAPVRVEVTGDTVGIDYSSSRFLDTPIITANIFSVVGGNTFYYAVSGLDTATLTGATLGIRRLSDGSAATGVIIWSAKGLVR